MIIAYFNKAYNSEIRLGLVKLVFNEAVFVPIGYKSI